MVMWRNHNAYIGMMRPCQTAQAGCLLDVGQGQMDDGATAKWRYKTIQAGLWLIVSRAIGCNKHRSAPLNTHIACLAFFLAANARSQHAATSCPAAA